MRKSCGTANEADPGEASVPVTAAPTKNAASTVNLRESNVTKTLY